MGALAIVDRTTNAVVQRGTRTAILLGTHLAEERCRGFVSLEALVSGSTRTEAWLDAVEHGEVDLTEAQVDLLQRLYRRRLNVNLYERIWTLRTYPVSAEARRLDDGSLGGTAERDASVGDIAAPAAGIRDALSAKDRLLLITPFLALIALCSLMVVVQKWDQDSTQTTETLYRTADEVVMISISTSDAGSDGTGDRLMDLIQRALLPLGFVAALGVALAAPLVEGLLRVLTAPFRLGSRRRRMRSMRKRLVKAGMPESLGWRWEIEPLLGFLMPRYRERAADAATRCRLCERLEPMFAISLLIAVVTARGDGLGDLAGQARWGIVVVCSALFAAARVVANGSAHECSSWVTLGLGWNRARRATS